MFACVYKRIDIVHVHDLGWHTTKPPELLPSPHCGPWRRRRRSGPPQTQHAMADGTDERPAGPISRRCASSINQTGTGSEFVGQDLIFALTTILLAYTKSQRCSLAFNNGQTTKFPAHRSRRCVILRWHRLQFLPADKFQTLATRMLDALVQKLGRRTLIASLGKACNSPTVSVSSMEQPSY